MRKKVKKLKKHNNSTKAIKPSSLLKAKTYDNYNLEPQHKTTPLIPFMPATPFGESEEIEKIIGTMKRESKLHTIYMQKEEARYNTLIKPGRDELNNFYDDFLEKQIMKDNQLEEALQATIAGEEINFALQKVLLK